MATRPTAGRCGGGVRCGGRTTAAGILLPPLHCPPGASSLSADSASGCRRRSPAAAAARPITPSRLPSSVHPTPPTQRRLPSPVRHAAPPCTAPPSPESPSSSRVVVLAVAALLLAARLSRPGWTWQRCSRRSQTSPASRGYPPATASNRTPPSD